MTAEVDNTTVSPTSEKKLREALERLLSGTQQRTDGRLIKENLYKEAGVSRATMNRATGILADWEAMSVGPQPRDRTIEQLQQSNSEHRSNVKALRQKINELQDQLTSAATVIGELHVENQILRGEDPTRIVRPLRHDVSKSALSR